MFNKPICNIVVFLIVLISIVDSFIISSISSVCSSSSSSLSSSSLCMSLPVKKGIIIGAGRIGNYLYEANNKQDLLLSSRDMTVPEGDESVPIYVCTRNNDLENIIEKTPSNRKQDLVFLQNGILTPYLQSKGLSENTQGLVYFAVSKKGETPIDGVTDMNPEGLTAVTGKWADDLAARLKNGGLSCHVMDKPTWEVAMLSKHIWICAFMAIGAKHGGITVGAVEKEHNAEVKELINEMAIAASSETGLKFPSDLADKLCAYARSVAHFPTALKEFEWRNGWFVDISLKAISELKKDPLPKHTEIMMAQKLFYKARKVLVKKLKEEGEAAEERWGIQRELKEIEEEDKKSPLNPPTSPTVLLNSKQ